ncbi:MAG: DnaJ domain-containing protein [bacterium]
MNGREKTESCLAILGVREGASMQDLKRAFRRKVSALHPDVNPGDPIAAEAFKKVTASYEYLKSLAREEKKPAKKETSIKQAAPSSYKPPKAASADAFAKTLPLDELVLRLRHSQNVYVRLHAVRAVGAVGGKEGVWALVQALEDADLRVVSESVMALGKLRARLAAMPLIQLHKKKVPQLKRQIEWALEQINTPIAAKYLLQVGAATPPQPDSKPDASQSSFNIA